MIFVFLLLWTCAHGQWILLKPDTPPLLDTSPLAFPRGALDASLWCTAEDDAFMYAHGVLWYYESESRRWFWQPNVPDAVGTRTRAQTWSMVGLLWLYGGLDENGRALHDLWSYDPSTRAWTPHTSFVGPSPGNLYGAATWTQRSSNALYLYGGQKDNNTISGELWSYDVIHDEWRVHSTFNSPGPRADATAVMGRSENTVYMFGGCDTQSALATPQLHKLDLATLNWDVFELGETHPVARVGHVMWMDATQEYVYVFAGHQQAEVFDDLWSFSVKSDAPVWTQEYRNSPSARYGAAYCVNHNTGYMHLFGGAYESATERHNDLWKFGPWTVSNVIQQIEFKLDTATLAALLGAAMSTICVAFFVFLSCIWCIMSCVKRKRARLKAKLSPQSEHDFTDL